MKKYFEKTSIALIIVIMFILVVFGGEAMKIHTNADNAKYKTVVNAQDIMAEKGTRTTTQVELGNYISLGKYNGKDIIWRCVSIDEKGALMLADNIIDTLPYDAMTNDNNRRTAATISVTHTAQTIGKTAICAPGLILRQRRAK